MRLVADANILVRVMVEDDPRQAATARRVLESADAIVLPTIVACEVAWVLRRSYRLTTQELHDALSALMRLRKVEADWAVLQAGLDHLALGGGFADGCILEMSRAAGCRLATFDRKLLRLAADRTIDAEQVEASG